MSDAPKHNPATLDYQAASRRMEDWCLIIQDDDLVFEGYDEDDDLVRVVMPGLGKAWEDYRRTADADQNNPANRNR